MIISQSDTVPAWAGKIIGCAGNGDPNIVLNGMAYTVPADHPTAATILQSRAIISYFRPKYDITVNKLRWYGKGSTTNFRVAVYNGDTLARLHNALSITTSVDAWDSTALSLTLTAGQLYFIAITSNTNSGATYGPAAFTLKWNTNQINTLPKSWAGNLDADLAIHDAPMFGTFTLSSGVLPDPANTIAAVPTLTCGFPGFFLDNDNS